MMDYLKLPKKHLEWIRQLPDQEKQGRMVLAMAAYAIEDEVPDFSDDPFLSLLWLPIRDALDNMADAAKKGATGGRPTEKKGTNTEKNPESSEEENADKETDAENQKGGFSKSAKSEKGGFQKSAKSKRGVFENQENQKGGFSEDHPHTPNININTNIKSKEKEKEKEKDQESSSSAASAASARPEPTPSSGQGRTEEKGPEEKARSGTYDAAAENDLNTNAEPLNREPVMQSFWDTLPASDGGSFDPGGTGPGRKVGEYPYNSRAAPPIQEDEQGELLRLAQKSGIVKNEAQGSVFLDLFLFYPAEWVRQALTQSIVHGGESLAYMDKVLKSFRARGEIDTEFAYSPNGSRTGYRDKILENAHNNMLDMIRDAGGA